MEVQTWGQLMDYVLRLGFHIWLSRAGPYVRQQEGYNGTDQVPDVKCPVGKTALRCAKIAMKWKKVYNLKCHFAIARAGEVSPHYSFACLSMFREINDGEKK